LAVYIALQQMILETVFRANVEGSATMNNLISQLPQQTAERVNEIIADVFNVATIALVGVLGVITVAATI